MKPHKYTEEERKFFEEYVPGHSHKEILNEFNLRFGGLGLKQVAAYIKNNKLNTGKTGRFESGHMPANKGKSTQTTGRMAETQFKKGNTPHNHLKVGAEILNTDGYWQVKIGEPDVWKLKHRLVWEGIHGEVPNNHIVIFADRDRNNFSPDNLILITRQQLVRMNQNGLIKADGDATKTGVIIAELINKTAEARNRAKKGR